MCQLSVQSGFIFYCWKQKVSFFFRFLVNVYCDRSQNVGWKEGIESICWNFYKALDTVSIIELLLEMRNGMNISGQVGRWNRRYLSGRVMGTVIWGCCWWWKEAIGGVPQGSVLGPVLFLVLLLTCRREWDQTLFADDVELMGLIMMLKEGDLGALDTRQDRCQVLEMWNGSGGQRWNYTSPRESLEESHCKKDLVILMENTLSFARATGVECLTSSCITGDHDNNVHIHEWEYT